MAVFDSDGDADGNTELFSSRKSKLANLLFLSAAGGTFQAQETGAAARAERIGIRWPSGQVRVLGSGKANQRLLVEES